MVGAVDHQTQMQRVPLPKGRTNLKSGLCGLKRFVPARTHNIFVHKPLVISHCLLIWTTATHALLDSQLPLHFHFTRHSFIYIKKNSQWHVWQAIAKTGWSSKIHMIMLFNMDSSDKKLEQGFDENYSSTPFSWDHVFSIYLYRGQVFNSSATAYFRFT